MREEERRFFSKIIIFKKKFRARKYAKFSNKKIKLKKKEDNNYFQVWTGL
jgi:DNA-binding protein H-NS